MKITNHTATADNVEKNFNMSYKQPSATMVTEDDEKGAWMDEDGVKYSKDGKKLLTCTNKGLTDYPIRQGTEVICDEAFVECESLQSVVIPSSVTTLGDSAFFWCGALRSVTIPDSVTNIGDCAFLGCSSLQSIFISHKTYDRLKVFLQWYSSMIKFTD